jgi:FAD:protein FMN transferase
MTAYRNQGSFTVRPQQDARLDVSATAWICFSQRKELLDEVRTTSPLARYATACRDVPSLRDATRRLGGHRRHRRHRHRCRQGAPWGHRFRQRAAADSEHLHDGGAIDNHHATHDHTHHFGPRWRLFVSHDGDHLLAPDNDDDIAADHNDDSTGRDVGRYKAMTAPLLAPLDTATTERSFRALGTTATVVITVAAHADEAERILRDEVEAIDLACSRFRPDSELASFHAHAGRTMEVSPLLFEALDVGYRVAKRTRGAVDPTVGSALASLGYDRHFDDIESRPLRLADLGPVPGFRHLHLDHARRTARIPADVRLDLGSSAKALLADRAAARVAEALGSGALISIGGDVAVAGEPPPEGWAIGIAVDSATGPDDVDQVVAIRQGGLASSGTDVRTWQMGTAQVHHIVDPATGTSSSPYWRLVSAVGASCVDANALSTAAVVWGDQAIERLRPFGQAVRLLRHDGEVFTLGGWPEEERP